MTVRTTALGGTDFIDGEVLYGTDLTDTIEEITNKFQEIYSSLEQETLSVSNSSSSVSYSEAMKDHLIKNIGTVNCYINIDAAATTDHFLLKPMETIRIKGSGTAVHAITASGTTIIRIIGQS